jgi:hypothetical protein
VELEEGIGTDLMLIVKVTANRLFINDIAEFKASRAFLEEAANESGMTQRQIIDGVNEMKRKQDNLAIIQAIGFVTGVDPLRRKS